jgi:hypothetical protein
MAKNTHTMETTFEKLHALTKSPLGLQELNKRIAAHCHTEPLFLIYRSLHDAFYRPKAAGYTTNHSDAWHVTAAEGAPHTLYADSKPGESCYSERVILIPLPPANYTGSLDVMATAERTLDERQQRIYAEKLHRVTRGLHGSFHHITADPPTRAVAFLWMKEEDQAHS